MKRRRFLQLGLGTTLATTAPLGAVFLSGCGQQGAAQAQIKMGVSQRPRSLDPRQATDALSSRVNRLIYRQLVDFNESFEPVPDLATWQQLSPVHYRFKLQAGNVFHTGEPVQAADVVATYQSVLDVATGSPHRGSLKGIDSVVAVSALEVDFILKAPDALFVGRLLLGILPEVRIKQQHDFQQHPIGSGACRFVMANEQKLVLQRPDGVQLVFLPVKDATVRVLKLQKGELDWIQNDLSPELVQYCDAHPQLKVHWHQGTSFGYMGFNFEDPLLSQLACRQAIAHGIDRQAIIKALFNDHARLASGLLVPEHWAGGRGLTQYEYNPEKAKKLLASCTLPQQNGDANKSDADSANTTTNPPGLVELSFKTSSDPTRIRLATIYQAQLKKIGIQLNIQSYDWGTFYNDIKQGRFQLYSLAWVGVKSPDIFQYVYSSDAIPPKGANRGRFRDALSDELIQKALNAQDLAAQAQLYKQLQSRIHETLASMPLWYEDQYAITRQSLAGYQLYADGRFDGILSAQLTID